MKCPNCKTPLDACYDLDPFFHGGALVSNGIWRCKNCPYGKNRFNGKLEPMDIPVKE